MYPDKAVIVKADQQLTDKYVLNTYYTHVDGGESNAYRHALWNAFMTLHLNSRALAESFATAHEDFPEEELRNSNWEGFNGIQHRDMDLYNNKKGRDCIAWYEVVLSDNTVSNRVKDKIRNGEMVILVR